MTVETLPQPASQYRMSYCAYCLHVRADHPNDNECAECILRGNGFWPACQHFTRTTPTKDEARSFFGLRQEGSDGD